MSEYTREEAFKLFEQVSDLFQGKPVSMILEVIINCVRGCATDATPEQQAIIMVTLLEGLGVDDNFEPENTLQ